jgi:hypothetical protein
MQLVRAGWKPALQTRSRLEATTISEKLSLESNRKENLYAA